MDVRRTLAELASPAVRPTIDLGDISGPDPAEPPDSVSIAARRGLLTALMAVVVAFGVAPSAPGRAFLGEPLWTAQASLAGFALGATTVVMSEPGDRYIVGRDLLTGTPRWRVMVAAPPQYTSELGNEIAAVVVGDRASDGTSNTDVLESTVTLLITQGGSVLAQIPGFAVVPLAIGRYLLVATGQSSVTLGCPEDRDRCTDMSAFDTTISRQVWRLPLTGNVIPSIADPSTGVRRLATISPADLVELRDPATGDIVSTYTLPWTGPHTQVAPRPPVLLIGDTLAVALREEDRAVLTAYPVGPTGRSWTASISVNRTVDPSRAQFYLAGCGQLLCLHVDGADNAFDPDTGAARVRVVQQIVAQCGDTLLAVPSTERPGSARERRMVYLYSSADGALLAALPDTALVPWQDSGARTMLAHQGHGQTDFMVPDRAGGGRLLGTVSGSDLTCSATTGVLVCTDPAGLVRVWRLP